MRIGLKRNTQADDDVWADSYRNNHLFVVPTGLVTKDYAGGHSPLLLHAVGVGNASERINWMKSHKAWLLREDWRTVTTWASFEKTRHDRALLGRALLNTSALSYFPIGARY